MKMEDTCRDMNKKGGDWMSNLLWKLEMENTYEDKNEKEESGRAV
jgi:hypothetical protein